jgi:hypothetical protein
MAASAAIQTMKRLSRTARQASAVERWTSAAARFHRLKRTAADVDEGL